MLKIVKPILLFFAPPVVIFIWFPLRVIEEIIKASIEWAIEL